MVWISASACLVVTQVLGGTFFRHLRWLLIDIGSLNLTNIDNNVGWTKLRYSVIKSQYCFARVGFLNKFSSKLIKHLVSMAIKFPNPFGSCFNCNLTTNLPRSFLDTVDLKFSFASISFWHMLCALRVKVYYNSAEFEYIVVLLDWLGMVNIDGFIY